MSRIKYTIYRCNTCDREIEIELDGQRPDPVRCNITLHCRGLFRRVGERSYKSNLITPVVSGLTDYIPRGTEIVNISSPSPANLITVFTAMGSGMIALTGVKRQVVGSTSNFYVTDNLNNQFIIETQSVGYKLPQTSTIKAVLFEISPELLNATKYVYSLTGPVHIVSGKDTETGRSLRFNSNNQLVVYVNGVQLAPSSYDRSVDNQITFTPPIYDSSNVVKVFVYQDLSTSISNSKQVSLSFHPLRVTVPAELSVRALNCWGNYGGTTINDIERLTLFCTDLSQLNIDKNYGISHFEATSALTSETRKIKPGELMFLLGREPFSFRDKELYAYLLGSSLINGQSIFAYRESLASGTLQLSIDETTITQTFNQIGLTKRITTITTNSVETIPGTSLEGTENLTPKYIIGPR